MPLPSARSATASFVIASAALLATVGIARAESPAARYWPQWRGPLGNGVAPASDAPVEWSESKNIKWKVAIPGRGTATPIIWGDQVFVQTAIPTGETAQAPAEEEPAPAEAEEEPAEEERGGRRRGGGRRRSATPVELHRFVVMSIDRHTGATRWEQTAREEIPHEGHHPDHGFSSHSPVTDGQLLFAFFGSRGLYCYDLEGNLQWEKDLGQMTIKNAFGEASSPALYEDTLVINWDHEGDAFIVALDKHTGNERWRQPRDEATTWATPLVVEHDGRAQVVTNGTNRVRSYDLETGEMLWDCEGLTANAIPSPVATDGLVFAMSGFRGAKLFAIRLGHTGDLTESDAIAWSHGRGTPYVPSPLLYDDRLYFYSGNKAILSSFNATTGDAVFGPERLQGLRNVYASPVGAGGKIYLVGRDGTTLVIRHADELEVLATNELDEGIDASPAVVQGALFLRGHQSLYCIAED